MEGRREAVEAKISGREQSARLKGARLSPLDSSDFLGHRMGGKSWVGRVGFPMLNLAIFVWMRLFCLQFEASCLQWSFFTYN